MGLETEYAFTVTGKGGDPIARSEASQRLMQLAKSTYRHLPDMGRGIFLPNGRLYIDSGQLPEFCTAECSTPWEMVCYTLSGERLLTDLAVRLAGDPEVSGVLLSKCNVDYSGAGSTWGCHESYGHRADPSSLPVHLIPHLVSRIIYTGAGGFNPKSSGLRFVLSPRVAHLSKDVSSSSTCGRGIFHTKQESLSGGGYHRLHILCGESLCSQTAAWLKGATTSLVVAMVEAGLEPGRGVQFLSPISAMRTFAADPRCRAVAKMADGRERTALDVQRHYLELAEAYTGHRSMPPWTPEACRHWRRMLDRLGEGAPGTVATTLDWAIKLALYKSWVQEHSRITWESLPHMSYVLEQLQQELRGGEPSTGRVSLSFVLGSSSPVRPTVTRLAAYMGEYGLDWGDFANFLDVRPELLEIDVHFGQLGDKGIFSALDRSGLLTHQMLGAGDVERALTQPPAMGRAQVRGKCILRLAGSNRRYACSWQKIVDRREKRTLDLLDPFETEERWVNQPSSDGDEMDIGDMLNRRYAARRAARRPVPDRLNVREAVVVVATPDPSAQGFIGRSARVAVVDESADETCYLLDVDGGMHRWRCEHLRRGQEQDAQT